MTVIRERGNGGRLVKATASSDGKPVWNEIMPAGTYHRKSFPGGVATFDRPFFEKVIANWKRGGGQALPIDRHHWGASDVAVPAEDKIAVGFMEDLRVGSNGSLEALCNWNDDGREDITKDRRRYVSPEWWWHFTDPLTGADQGPTLTNASLLNDPFFTELPRMAASQTDANEENLMTRDELISLYGLPKDATDADIKAAAKKGADAAKAEKAAKETAAAAGKEKLELEEKLAAETAAREASDKKAADQEKRLGELEKASKEREAKQLEKDGQALCSRLEREGRIIATQKDDVLEDCKLLGLEKATKRWEKVPAKVVLRELGGSGDGGTETKETAHKKFMELVDVAQADAKKAGEPLSVNQAYSKVKATHPEIARVAFSQH